jgi:Fe-S oxidoreductase/nitrate reductase gamma subunit
MHGPQGEITREVFWNILSPGSYTEQIILYILALTAFLLLGRALYKGGFGTRLKIIFQAKGTETNRLDNVGERLWYAIVDVFGHKKILREPYQGIFHLFIFYGFIALTITTAIVFFQADILYPITGIWFMKGTFYLVMKLFANVFGMLAIVGILMALYRRYVIKPNWLDQKPEDNITLWFILTILVTGFIIEGIRMQAVEMNPTSIMYKYVWFSPGGRLVAPLFSWMSESALRGTHYLLWWFHVLMALTFFVYVGYTKLLHIFMTPANIFLRSTEQAAPIRVMPPEMFECAETFGIHNVEEYSWKDLFDQEACMRCGRCVEVCPAFNTDKPLKPRDVIQNIRTYLEEKAKFAMNADGSYCIIGDEEYTGPKLIGDCIEKETAWACTTCMACVEACPSYILQFPKLIELRRYMVMMESDFAPELMGVFKGMENNSNPWSIGAHTRADWAKDLGIPLLSEKGSAEYLFYVGCAGAFDELNKRVAVSLSKIFEAAGLDYAILGTEEGCCGDSAKKLGNEYIYQALAMANIETFKGYGVKKIIALCPHGFNTLKYDYKELGGNFEVYHYTEILDTLIKSGRIKIKERISDLGTITYHDSCYLGRYNKVYDQPRDILKAISSSPMVEMKSHHEKSFCCGAGGGRMWMEEHLGTRINQMRTNEALDSGAKTICTACPFCFTMLTDGIKELELSDKLQSADIATLVARAAGIDLKGTKAPEGEA